MDVNVVSIDPYTERFSIALLLALVVHLVAIYGIGFVFPEHTKPQYNSMEIILVQTHADQSPKQADYLAQANQLGGGDPQQPQERPTTPTVAPFPNPSPDRVIVPLPPQMAMDNEEQQIETLTAVHTSPHQIESQSEITPPKEPAEQGNDPQTTLHEYLAENTLLINAQAAKLASIQAELSAKFNSYAKRLRRKRIHANTKENKYVNYMVRWRRKVEEIGNANYPDKARQQKLSGTLVLDVALNPNGTVRELVIKKPSRYPILDEAALRIVRLAAPFEPFPEEIRKETDILHITRTWEFRYNSLTSR